MDKNGTQKRIGYIDIAKGIGIILVVIGHIVSGNGLPQLYISSFHMPLFFLLAGLCFNPSRYATFWDYLTRKSKTLLLPMLCFTIINLALSSLILPDYYSLEKLTSLRLPNAMWFIPVLFLTEITSYAILRLTAQKTLLVTIPLTLSLTLTFILNGINSPLNILCMPFASVFYLTGFALRKHLTGEGTDRLTPILSATAVLLPLPLVYFTQDTIIMMLNHLPCYGIEFITAAILASAGIIQFSKTIQAVPYLTAVLKYLGRNSLIVLCLHPFIIDMSCTYISPVITSHLAYKTVESAMIWTCCTISIELINRYAGFIVGKR